MLPFPAPLMSLIRPARKRDADDCLVCGRAMRAADEVVHVPGGGHVYRGCATYRMRQQVRGARQRRTL